MNNIKNKLINIKEKLEQIGIIKLLIIVIVIVAIFQAGIFVGYHKAMFYKSASNNYYKQGQLKGNSNRMPMGSLNKRNSVNTPEGFNNLMQEADIPGGHGAVGKIVSINLPNMIVASSDNIEKTITISNETLVRQFRDNVQVSNLKVGDYVAVLGEISGSDNGIVKAKLIRILPPPLPLPPPPTEDLWI